MPPLLPTLTASGFSHTPMRFLTISLPLTLRAIRGCSPYETFLITSISLRPIAALFFSPGNRHLVTHKWDRLLLLIDLGIEPRTNSLKWNCSTIELVSNLPWCAAPDANKILSCQYTTPTLPFTPLSATGSSFKSSLTIKLSYALGC